MIVKLVAIFVLLGVCCALPEEEPKAFEVAPSNGLVPLEPQALQVEDLPNPSKPGDSDLQTDASTWWRSNWYHYHHNHPSVYYKHSAPAYYTYWKTYY